jgi:hypothetical protein
MYFTSRYLLNEIEDPDNSRAQALEIRCDVIKVADEGVCRAVLYEIVYITMWQCQ